VIDPATAQMWCDGIDDAGRTLGSIAVALLVATTLVVTGALFLGLAIRYSVRTIVRRFVAGKI
jgi:hypothetical protein